MSGDEAQQGQQDANHAVHLLSRALPRALSRALSRAATNRDMTAAARYTVAG
jgi:hypothetical protein